VKPLLAGAVLAAAGLLAAGCASGSATSQHAALIKLSPYKAGYLFGYFANIANCPTSGYCGPESSVFGQVDPSASGQQPAVRPTCQLLQRDGGRRINTLVVRQTLTSAELALSYVPNGLFPPTHGAGAQQWVSGCVAGFLAKPGSSPPAGMP